MDQSRIDAMIVEAGDALEQDEFLRALALADQLVALVPEDSRARTIRAKALLQSGSHEAAVEEARRATEYGPGDVAAHVILWLSSWQLNRLGQAQQAMEKAIALSDRRPGLLVDYAWFMAAERGPRLAEAAAKDAIAAAPQSSTAWAALGLAQFRLHRRAEAEESLKRALKLDPNDPYAQSVMVSLLHDQRQDQKAVALAHLLEDTPGTEAIVAKVREEARQRQIARKLVERDAYPIPFREPQRRRWLWWLGMLFGAAVLAGWLVLAFQPQTPVGYGFCIATPVAFLWILVRIFG